MDGANSDQALYSRIKGIHTLPWKSAAKANCSHTFNCSADVVREESFASQRDNEPSTYSTSRKDMTCVLQFMPPLHFGERVSSILLEKVGKSDTQISAMGGRDVILTLAGLRDKLDHIMDTHDVMPSSVSRDTVDAAGAPGGGSHERTA